MLAPEFEKAFPLVGTQEVGLKATADCPNRDASFYPASPSAKVAATPGVFIVVLAAPPTAPVHISVFGVFDKPFVPDV